MSKIVFKIGVFKTRTLRRWKNFLAMYLKEFCKIENFVKLVAFRWSECNLLTESTPGLQRNLKFREFRNYQTASIH